MNICVYEDRGFPRLWPLTATRPVYDLFIGASTLVEKIKQHFPDVEKIHLYTRNYLTQVLEEKYPEAVVNKPPTRGETLLINGRLILNKAVAEALRKSETDYVFYVGDEVAAIKLAEPDLPENFWNSFTKPEESFETVISHLNKRRLDTNLLTNLWDIVELAPKLVAEEAEGDKSIHGYRGRVFTRGEVEVENHVVLDDKKGPIVLDDNVVVEAFTKIVGPCFVGKSSRIFPNSYVSGCCFGPVCRVGGEVEECVFMGYSNKRHYGFLGHSVVGEWVNIAAGTTVSNMKNTYGTFRITVEGRRVETGRQFLGTFFADHVKTGIGTMVSGGIKIGVASHVYREAHADIPSFTIHTPMEKIEIDIEQALETAKRMMARRGVKPSKSYLEMLRNVFDMTADERRSAGVLKKRFSFYNTSGGLSHG
ncbi:MAG: putative sugar nucleotidyl transferase [Candidatus Caldarchaeum sp.]